MNNSIVLVPMNEGYDLKGFSNMLSKTFQRTYSTVVLNSQNVSRGNSHVAQATSNSILEKSLMYSLSRYAEKYQQLIYITDHTWSNWSERCLTTHNNIFLVGEPGSQQPLTPIAKELLYHQSKISANLIVEYPTKLLLKKKSIAYGLKPKNVNAIYAFAKNNLADFENIVCQMTSKKSKMTYEKRKSVA